MKLYLVRHGESQPKEIDADQSLSNQGREHADRLAQFLQDNKNMAVAKIFHSGKTRARQTAEILAAQIARGMKIGLMEGMTPMDPVALVADTIETWNEDVMLVGHLPFMGKLAALLVTGDEESGVAIFRSATMVCLEKIEGRWLVAWMVCPELLL